MSWWPLFTSLFLLSKINNVDTRYKIHAKMLGLVAVAENRHGQSDGQNPFEIDSLRPLATATASARGSQNRFKMITLTLFMPTFGSSCPYSHLSSKLLTHPFLRQTKDGVDWACISRWAFKDNCRPGVRLDYEDEREISWVELLNFFQKMLNCTVYTVHVYRVLYMINSMVTCKASVTVVAVVTAASPMAPMAMITVWPWFHGPATNPRKY